MNKLFLSNEPIGRILNSLYEERILASKSALVKQSELEKFFVATTRKVLMNCSYNPILKRKNTFSFSSKSTLKDHELRCLSIASLALPQESPVGWELRMFILQKSHSQDVLPRLLSECKNLGELYYRINNLSPSLLENLRRSYKQGLQSGLKKLRVILPSTGNVNYPIRKRGYNDHGSFDPDSAWKHSRPFWLDTETQKRTEQQRKDLRDLENLLRGFSD